MDKKISCIQRNYLRCFGKPVAIYARVSTTSAEQLKSIQHQVSRLTEKIFNDNESKLVDIYIDFASGKAAGNRPEWDRMGRDAKNGKFKCVYTKSVSRFGRDTVDGLKMINTLRENGVRVIFDNENICSTDSDFHLFYSVAVAVAQAENEDRSENIRHGIRMQSQNGNSKLYNRKCYGYTHDAKGELIIDEKAAAIVRLIFQWYIEGASVERISNELHSRGIASPTGKEKWSNRTIDTILQNEKYTGEVMLFKTVTGDYPNTKARRLTASKMLCSNHHQAIVSKEIFNDAFNRRYAKKLSEY